MVDTGGSRFSERVRSKLSWLYAQARARPAKRRRMVNDGRRILEAVIFQAVARNPALARILSVGCHRYSAWYPTLFDHIPGKIFETVDPDSVARQFGSALHHHQSGFTELADNPQLHGRYDLIIISGVFGYGINEAADKQKAFEAAGALLRKDGLLLIGYSPLFEIQNFDRSIIDGRSFRDADVPGFSDPFVQSKNDNGHAYLCLRRL